MFLKESVIRGADNSGCSTARILQVYERWTHHLRRTVRVVLVRFDPRRNLKAKKHYQCSALFGTRVIRRVCDFVFAFIETCVIFMADLRKKLLGSTISTAVSREGLQNKVLDKSIRQKVISLASFTM